MNDTRTAAERRYDAERDGSLYFPKPAADDDEPLSEDEWIILAHLDARTDAEPADVPFGTLADGTPIMGTFDGTARTGWHRMDCVVIDTPAWSWTVGGDGGVAGGATGNNDIYLENITIADLLQLRDFLNSGALERMQATAVAWGRGDAEPPAA